MTRRVLAGRCPKQVARLHFPTALPTMLARLIRRARPSWVATPAVVTALACGDSAAWLALMSRGVSAMPFELTTPGGFFFARISGMFTAPELNRLTTEVEIAEALHPVALDRITDLTTVELFEVSFRDIYNFAVRRGAQRFTRVVKSAIVVCEPVQFGMARMYEALNVNPQIKLRIVRSVADAKKWFTEIDEEDVEAKDDESKMDDEGVN
jgi:hypothetical protein